jgi:hypothetical protein
MVEAWRRGRTRETCRSWWLVVGKTVRGIHQESVSSLTQALPERESV